jgi:tRNA 2-thiouridine synthesizing protein B
MSAMLHIINKSPSERSSLASCLRLAEKGSSILLIEDGVYAAMANSSFSDQVLSRQNDFKFYVLHADLQARGLSDVALIESVTPVDYERFVDLVIEHRASQSWF